MVSIEELRERDLAQVMDTMGAIPDKRDKHNWRIENGGRISISKDGYKWYDHSNMKGGGGAIDLVMHIKGSSFKEAIEWLQNAVLSSSPVRHQIPVIENVARTTIPEAHEANWLKVRRYLVSSRSIPDSMVDSLYNQGVLYADKMENAVFLNHKKTGCELRGTKDGSTFHGYRGQKEGFVLKGDHITHGLAFVESGIDALSYKALGFQGTIVSYGGQPLTKMVDVVKDNRSRNPDLKIISAFDNDSAGIGFTEILKKEISDLIIDVPQPGKDWNESLQIKTSGRTNVKKGEDLNKDLQISM